MKPRAANRLFRHVLCPVDFSAYSRTALRYAAALARRSKGRLTVLFVNDPLLGTGAAAAGYDVKALAARTTTELRRFVAHAIGSDADRVTLLTAFGQPATEIQRTTERLGVGLVAMGSRGLTGPGKWFFGSTTERVLHTARVPVLVIPKSKGPRTRAQWIRAMRSWPGKRILIPVDIGDYAVADVRAAMNVARALNAKVLLVHAMPPSHFPPWLRADTPAHDRDRAEGARTRLEGLAETVGGLVECQVVVGDPAGQIAARATDVRAGLIVLTLKRASTPFGPRQGSITYRVLSSEVAPILAIPESRPRS